MERQYPDPRSAIEPPCALVLRMYPPGVVVAEKLHAMVVLDIRNSRMNDSYELWYLARTRSFGLATLHQAVVSTFERRHKAATGNCYSLLLIGSLQTRPTFSNGRAFCGACDSKEIHRVGNVGQISRGVRRANILGNVGKEPLEPRCPWHN